MTPGVRRTCLALVLLCGFAGARSALPQQRRSGPVRLSGHCLVDDGGPFLGLGATYMSAVWDCRNDRPNLARQLGFLSRNGFNYIRVLSMVGWRGHEIAPVGFTSPDGAAIRAWPDYWKQMADLVDTAYDLYGLRTEITIFADAHIMPGKAARIAHLDGILNRVVRGREDKVILLEVANEGWQNGFPGEQGLADMREFAAYLAHRTNVLVAISSDHIYPIEKVYRGSAADIATWHFSRDLRPNRGWEPVYDCWSAGGRRDLPPVSSNEPIGPGSSVNSQTDPVHLVMAAAFAYTAGLPMYVFHSSAGVLGARNYEGLPGIDLYRGLLGTLPRDLPNWERNDGKGARAPFTAFSGGKPNKYWTDASAASDGCIRNTGSRSGREFVCVPIGIQSGGLRLRARESMTVRVYDPLTARVARRAVLKAGDELLLPRGPGAYIIRGTVVASRAAPPPRGHAHQQTRRSCRAIGLPGILEYVFTTHLMCICPEEDAPLWKPVTRLSPWDRFRP